MSTHSPTRRLSGGLLLAAVAACAGCINVERGGERLSNTLPAVETVVVAPMMNLSTSPRVDMVETTKALAGELQQVEGLTVVPLGRVYQYLAANDMATVGTPAEARALARAFDAQATLVSALTEYDPYDPPRMGLAVQFYAAEGLGGTPGETGFDPVEASRSAQPFETPEGSEGLPEDMIVRLFDGRSEAVEDLARLYARERDSAGGALGWRRFLVDQRAFQRLCSYGIVRELLGPEGRKQLDPRINIGPRASGWPK